MIIWETLIIIRLIIIYSLSSWELTCSVVKIQSKKWLSLILIISLRIQDIGIIQIDFWVDLMLFSMIVLSIRSKIFLILFRIQILMMSRILLLFSISKMLWALILIRLRRIRIMLLVYLISLITRLSTCINRKMILKLCLRLMLLSLSLSNRQKDLRTAI